MTYTNEEFNTAQEYNQKLDQLITDGRYDLIPCLPVNLDEESARRLGK